MHDAVGMMQHEIQVHKCLCLSCELMQLVVLRGPVEGGRKIPGEFFDGVSGFIEVAFRSVRTVSRTSSSARYVQRCHFSPESYHCDEEGHDPELRHLVRVQSQVFDSDTSMDFVKRKGIIGTWELKAW